MATTAFGVNVPVNVIPYPVPLVVEVSVEVGMPVATRNIPPKLLR